MCCVGLCNVLGCGCPVSVLRESARGLRVPPGEVCPLVDKDRSGKTKQHADREREPRGLLLKHDRPGAFPIKDAKWQ